MAPPLITLEEHFFSTATLDSLDGQYSEQLKHVPGVLDKLRDLDQLRLRDMDAGDVAFQVISHGPGNLSAEKCCSANDQLANAVSMHPQRFAGFAVLPMHEPEAAAQELTRCTRELKFVGALVNNHAGGTFYDGSDYIPFFEVAQTLDVPIYLHPTWPADEMALHYSGNFSTGAGISIGSSGFGWHSETGLHILRLFASGLFDRLPRLKIIIGHFGEMIPFQLERICTLSRRWGDFQRNFRQVWDENIWVTTSGVWSLDPMACLLRNTKIERILYSVDYPFTRTEDGLRWIKDLETSGMVTPEQLEMIAYKNSEDLLGLKLR